MGTKTEDRIYPKSVEELEPLYNRFLLKYDGILTQVEASQNAKKRDEAVEVNLVQELKKNANLKEDYEKLCKIKSKLHQIVVNSKKIMVMKESDEMRLSSMSSTTPSELGRYCYGEEVAQETQQDILPLYRKRYLAMKAVSGINFNFKGAKHIWAGYVKNKSMRELAAFEIDTNKRSDKNYVDELWSVLFRSADPKWLSLAEFSCNDKENILFN